MAKAYIFPHYPIEKAANTWFKKNKALKSARAGWESSKAMVIASSVVNYGVRATTSSYMVAKGTGYAWEDFTVALRGHGDNIITGPLLHMWTNIYNESDRVSLGKALNGALAKIQQQCDLHGYKHRYTLECRSGPVLTDDTEFTFPVAIPSSGRPLLRWAEDQGYDVELVREYLLSKIAESESKKERQTMVDAARSMDNLPPDVRDNLISFDSFIK